MCFKFHKVRDSLVHHCISSISKGVGSQSLLNIHFLNEWINTWMYKSHLLPFLPLTLKPSHTYNLLVLDYIMFPLTLAPLYQLFSVCGCSCDHHWLIDSIFQHPAQLSIHEEVFTDCPPTGPCISLTPQHPHSDVTLPPESHC